MASVAGKFQTSLHAKAATCVSIFVAPSTAFCKEERAKGIEEGIESIQISSNRLKPLSSKRTACVRLFLLDDATLIMLLQAWKNTNWLSWRLLDNISAKCAKPG